MKLSRHTAILAAFALFPMAVQGQTPAEIAGLRKEIADLKKEIDLLKRHLGLLKAGTTPAGFAARFDAANSLGSVNEREASFAKLAIDAAKGGDVKISKKCIDSLGSINSREDCMYRACLHFATNGHAEEAVAMAKSLGSISQREKALAKIAKGEVDD